MTNLDDRLDEIKHRKLDLTPHIEDRREGNPHRPELSVWAEVDDDGNASAVLSIGDLWGQQKRFVEMTPGEARQLARMLLGICNQIDTATEAA